MKMEITQSGFMDAFSRHGREDSFSYDGLRVLYDYLEENYGEDYELDVVALDCEWSEYDSAVEAAKDIYDWEPDDEDDQEKEALGYMEDRGSVIPVPGGGILFSG